MYDERIEQLISAALADGVLTEKEKQILFKRAQEQDIDLDEFEMVLDARLVELQKAEKEKAAISAPKSNKLGDVRKCPQCGAVIGSFVMICPDCGFEFSNVGPNQYVLTFSKKLEEALAKDPELSDSLFGVLAEIFLGSSRKEKKFKIQTEKNFVENYPMPMTKEDCVEMLNYILPKIKEAPNKATKAWKNKFDAILNKLELENSNNQKILQIVESFRKQAQPSKTRRYIKIALISAAVLLPLIIVSVNLVKENVAKKEYQQQCKLFDEYILAGDADKAQQVWDAMTYSQTNDHLFALAKLYLSKDDYTNAIDFCRKGELKNRRGARTFQEEILVPELIRLGRYDEAWSFVPYGQSDIGGADEYFEFMSDVILYLCRNNRKQDARRFVNEYVIWFSSHVDTYKTKKDEWVQEYYREYNSVTAKSKLLKFINNY